MLDLDAIKRRRAAITPAPWYPRATDDWKYQGARYVSTEAGPGGYDWRHDGATNLDVDDPGVDTDRVIAITLLQSPTLATPDECDGNTEFIAHAPTDIDALLAEVERLRARESEADSIMQDLMRQIIQAIRKILCTRFHDTLSLNRI